MTVALPEDQRQAFNRAWFSLALGATGSSMEAMVAHLTPYDGKTAEEIIRAAAIWPALNPGSAPPATPILAPGPVTIQTTRWGRPPPPAPCARHSFAVTVTNL